MSAIAATLRFGLSVLETFTAAEMPASKNRTVTDDGFNTTVNLGAATTPPGTKGWAALLSGTQTIDATALTRTVGPAINATGLRLQALLVNNLSTTATVSLAKGSSNGLPFNGASGGLVVPPSGSALLYFADGLADVAAGAKTIDITVTPAGSGTEVLNFQIQLVFG